MKGEGYSIGQGVEVVDFVAIKVVLRHHEEQASWRYQWRGHRVDDGNGEDEQVYGEAVDVVKAKRKRLLAGSYVLGFVLRVEEAVEEVVEEIT